MPKVKALMSLQLLCFHRIYRVIETSTLWLSKEPDDDVASVGLCQRNKRNVSPETQNAVIDSTTERQQLNPFYQLRKYKKYLFEAKTKVFRCFRRYFFIFFFHVCLFIQPQFFRKKS